MVVQLAKDAVPAFRGRGSDGAHGAAPGASAAAAEGVPAARLGFCSQAAVQWPQSCSTCESSLTKQLTLAGLAVPPHLSSFGCRVCTVGVALPVKASHNSGCPVLVRNALVWTIADACWPGNAHGDLAKTCCRVHALY